MASLARTSYFTPVVVAWLVGCRSILGIDPLPGDGPADAAGDAMPDAAPDVDAAPYCPTLSPRPDFCSSFDETNFEASWDNDDDASMPDPGEIGSGQLSADRQVYESWPASLHVKTIDNVSSSVAESAVVLKTIPWKPYLNVQFDIRVSTEDFPGTGDIILASIDYGIGAVVVYLGQEGLLFSVVPDPGVETVVQRNFPAGSWTTIKVIVTNAPGDSGPDGWVAVAASDVGLYPTTTLPASFQDPNLTVKVVLGATTAVGGVEPFEANIDNVRMYWHD